MSSQYNGFLVVLDENIREDDAQPILDAIGMIKGVLKVTPNIADSNEAIARCRVTVQMQQALMNVAQNLGKGNS